MNLYLDDNLTEAQLINLLLKTGHSVVSPSQVGMSGKSDARHYEFAIQKTWSVLTRDREDFEDLHNLILTAGGSHPGVLVIRYEKDSSKGMKPKHIARAINRLVKSGLSCSNSYIILNHWR